MHTKSAAVTNLTPPSTSNPPAITAYLKLTEMPCEIQTRRFLLDSYRPKRNQLAETALQRRTTKSRDNGSSNEHRRGSDPTSVVKNRAQNEISRRRNMHRIKGAASHTADRADVSGDTKQLKDELASFLNSRYNPDLKLLDLSNLRTWNSGSAATASIFDKSFSKAFGVLMVICEEAFKTDDERREAVQSVRLANNDLVNLRVVTDLPSTFPHLKNLDLSSNKLKDLDSICIWRPRLRQLEHVLLIGNPLEHVKDFEKALFKRIPSLKIVNSISKPENHVTQRFTFPVCGGRINDSGTVGVDFIKLFFSAYDTDRISLATSFYDSNSQFSLNVITKAPRKITMTGEAKPPGWNAYLKYSRNLTRITSVSGKTARVFKGDAIRDVWTQLPVTRHPNLMTQGDKWSIEIDHTSVTSQHGQVTGLYMIMHGEFEEVDTATNTVTAKRSFSRTIIIGPGCGPGGVRAVSDLLTLRAYGGSNAFTPSYIPPPTTLNTTTISQLSSQADTHSHPSRTDGWHAPEGICIPHGWGVATPGKPEEQVKMEQAAYHLSKETHMTLEYSGTCLAENGWDLAQAYHKFTQVKDSIPPEGWMKTEIGGKFVGSEEVEAMLMAQGLLAIPAAVHVEEEVS